MIANSPPQTRANKTVMTAAGNLTNNNKKEPTLKDVMAQLQEMSKENAEHFGAINSQLMTIRDEQTVFRADLNNLNGLQSAMKEEHHKIKTQVETLSATVGSLSDQVSSLKQAQLGQNVIISGVSPDIKVEQKHIANIARLLNIDSILTVIAVNHIKTKKSAITKVVFATKEMRDRLLLARRGKSIFVDEIGLAKDHQQVFMQEDLIPHNQNLLFQARSLKKIGFSGSWASDGLIKVRHLSANKIITIKSEMQIRKLMDEHKEEEVEPK